MNRLEHRLELLEKRTQIKQGPRLIYMAPNLQSELEESAYLIKLSVKIAYENGSLRGTPKGRIWDCYEVRLTMILTPGYPARAKLIADRRIYLAGYRLAELLRTVSTN